MPDRQPEELRLPEAPRQPEAPRAAPRTGLPRRIAAAALALVLAVTTASPQPAVAQGQPKLPIVRDAETEALLKDYMTPILRAAGLAKQNVEVTLINDRSFNAFVADGRRIFVFLGTLVEAKTPNEVIGVLAHETGHIAGGHLARMRQQLAAAQTVSIVAFLLSLGAVAAGAAAGSARDTNLGGALGGIMTGPQEMIRRSLLSYQRGEEQAADRAAISYLHATHQSPKGMLETFRRLSDQSLFISRGVDPYMLSHPLPRERISQLEELVAKSPYRDTRDPAELQLRHDLMRAKIIGYFDRSDTVARRYPPRDTSLPARYARAISAYRFKQVREAIAQIDGLIAAQPRNPYFYELKGQALLESARPAEAIAPLRRAVALAPNANLIRIMLGQALVATGDKAHAEEAIRELSRALTRETLAADGYRQLAIAYGRKGDIANADLASAQAAFAGGEFKTARHLAARAKTRFANGSPGWLKADDIENYKPPKLDGKS
ncbi:M48 family metalloprotease [Blastochloris sulfoviridis]|uniref:M48 family metallopeptidase n=1 Tax=Blastochloris sulfoviridis TaxID=50712 RepID=A0A5M6I1B8_9HYPH|nr:M48 family metalloprotease [Blastochloris sulfoviridis]KAA5601962.1 M48 family metallopeptidase [Blastochloris sulfoviridis]